MSVGVLPSTGLAIEDLLLEAGLEAAGKAFISDLETGNVNNYINSFSVHLLT